MELKTTDKEAGSAQWLAVEITKLMLVKNVDPATGMTAMALALFGACQSMTAMTWEDFSTFGKVLWDGLDVSSRMAGYERPEKSSDVRDS